MRRILETVRPRRTAMAAALLLLAAGTSLYAAGAAEYGFQNPAPSVSATYDPNQEQDLPLTARFYHFGFLGNSTNWFLTFSTGQSGTFTTRYAQSAAGGRVNYQLLDSASSRNVLKDLSVSPTAAEIIAGTNSASGFQTLTAGFTAAIPGGQLPNAGTYTDSVTMTIYAGTLTGTHTSNATQAVGVTITVPAIVNLSLVPTGGSFNPGATSAVMDFGLLGQGQTRSTDLLVRSNASYSVSLQSLNGGVMKNSIAGDTSTVPYSLSFAGAPVALPAGSASTVVSSAAPTSAGGTRYPIQVTIGDFGMATAGAYQDSITITVTAN
ncbi:spore coat protein U domain-containing protein [Salinispira pacifica]